MPLTGLAKQIYNKEYYKKHRIKLNAERIVKLVKSQKQKRVKQPTIVKYEPGFTHNQQDFLERLALNSKLERKNLYELPEQAPILEVPIQPEDIPFQPRLPETRVFRENTNQNTFTPQMKHAELFM
eukprot:8022320-Pyramimonas_sp.AAC.1